MLDLHRGPLALLLSVAARPREIVVAATVRSLSRPREGVVLAGTLGQARLAAITGPHRGGVCLRAEPCPTAACGATSDVLVDSLSFPGPWPVAWDDVSWARGPYQNISALVRWTAAGKCERRRTVIKHHVMDLKKKHVIHLRSTCKI